MSKDMKTAVITGGTQGIGAAVTQAFVQAGYFVVVGARQVKGVPIRSEKQCVSLAMDVRYEKDHLKLVQLAMKKTGRLDVYVNCAGFSQWAALADISDQLLTDLLDTNLKGTLWGCKAAAAHLKEGGSLINLASLAGKRGSAHNSAYCASKFGVVGLTQALAKELGPKGIRVNAVCPVYVETAGLKSALKAKASPARGRNVDSYLKDFALSQSALLRLPLATEVAQTCLFLASDAASAITGQSINVDCGVLPQ